MDNIIRKIKNGMIHINFDEKTHRLDVKPYIDRYIEQIESDSVRPVRNVDEHVKCKNCGKDIQIEGKQMCNKCLN